MLLVLLALNRPRRHSGERAAGHRGRRDRRGHRRDHLRYPLLIQLHGRLRETGTPWQIGKYGNHETDFYTAPMTVALNHGLPRYLQFLEAQHIWPLENYAYLGWPLLAALLLITVTCWRDLRVRIAAIAFAVVELCSMGGHRQHLFGLPLPAAAMPWHYIDSFRSFHEAVPNRLSLPAEGLAALVIAFGADHVGAAWRRQEGWHAARRRRHGRSLPRGDIAPIIPRPVQTATRVPAPAGWTQVPDWRCTCALAPRSWCCRSMAD